MNESGEAPDFLFCIARGALARLLLIAAGLAIVFYARRVFLVAFAGVLLAIVLRALAGFLARHAFISAKRSYPALLGLIVIVALGLGYLLGPRILTEGHEIINAIPRSVANLETAINQYEWGRDITRIVGSSVQSQRMSGWATGIANTAVELITDGIVLLVIGLFLAADPLLYRKGLLYLVPKSRRDRAFTLLQDIRKVLTGWFLGQLIPMSALGIGSLIGLWLLGIPLAFTLALFTSLMLFVPYAGAILAFIPTALIAFTKSPVSMLYVTALYLGIHIAEGYVITPLAQKYAVRLPPALTLLSQLFMWKVAGLLGVFVATPLAAASIVIVKSYQGARRPENIGRAS